MDTDGSNAEAARQKALRLIEEGNALEDAGRWAETLRHYESAIALAPELARGHLNRGNVLLAMGDAEAALAAYATALERDPDYAAAHFNAGNAHARVGRHEAALAAYRRAIALKPDFADAEVATGNVLEDLDRLDEAVTSYRRATQLDPDLAEAHYNLGIPLQRLGRLDEAVATFRQALRIRPAYVQAHTGLGKVLTDLDRLEEAVASHRRATQLDPGFAEAHYNLGIPLQRLGRLDEAEASYRQALQIRPGYVEAHAGLGHVLEEMMRPGEAEASYRRALEVMPDFAMAHGSLLFCLSHDEAVDPQRLFAEHLRFGERFERPLRGSWPVHANDRNPARCLQVGLVSGDLRDHAVAHFVEPILERLAGRPGLSLHAYYNHAAEGRATPRLRGYVKRWHRIAGMTDEALASRIVADGIDILVDLSGHTGENRLLTFARKPAPVQASWIGYPGTTGLEAMDYYLADRHFLPPGQFDGQFTEKLVYLPANAPFLPDETAPAVNALPALERGYVTFGSFNRPSKLSRPVIALWSRLLRSLPDARMLLGGMPRDGGRESLTARFAAEGVAPERLDFHGRSDLQSYLGLHHQVDLCLDTFPYAGGTTTFHALWMGVPTLTLAGRSAPGRQGAAIMGHLGLQDFVAGDAEAFVAKGLRWARDPAALAALRAGMRERFERTPIGRPEVIAAGLERAFRAMWQRWCAGLPPETIDVTDDPG